MQLQTCKARPPSFAFRFNLNGVLKLSTVNYDTGNKSSNIVSATMKISMSCNRIGFIMAIVNFVPNIVNV